MCPRSKRVDVFDARFLIHYSNLGRDHHCLFSEQMTSMNSTNSMNHPAQQAIKQIQGLLDGLGPMLAIPAAAISGSSPLALSGGVPAPFAPFAKSTPSV